MINFRPQLFDALALGTVVVAVAVGAWRSAPVEAIPFDVRAIGAQVAPTPAQSPDSVSTLLNTTLDDSVAIVNANIFSASRRAPRVHYVSPDEMSAIEAMALSTPFQSATDSIVSDSTGAANSDSVPRLYGIVSQEGVRRALLRLSEQDASPRLFNEGDRHSGWQVLRIDADRVTIRSSSGQRTLRLARTPPRDL